MAPKNIDETIQKLLSGYAQWCYTILQKDHKRLQKQYFPTKEDRTKAIQEYTEAKHAYEYLLKIVADPKKYLYSGKDLIYSDTVDYNKLMPVLGNRFDKSQKHLLVRLSEAIAHHVNYGKNDHNGVWVYYGNSLVFDLDAESIIKMNREVDTWKSNAFVAALKQMLPSSVFAVDLHKNER